MKTLQAIAQFILIVAALVWAAQAATTSVAQVAVLVAGAAVTINLLARLVELRSMQRKSQQLQRDLENVAVTYKQDIPAQPSLSEFNSPDDAFHYFRAHGYNSDAPWAIAEDGTMSVLDSPNGRYQAMMLDTGDWPTVKISYRAKSKKRRSPAMGVVVKELNPADIPLFADVDAYLYGQLWAEWHLADMDRPAAA